MTHANPVPETVTLHVPFRVVKRGGRKEMQLPPDAPARRKPDNTIIKALARAFRWKRLLESGGFTTVKELAKHEEIAPSYIARVLHLTLLEPNIVEAILEGDRDYQLSLAGLLNAFPVEWQVQRQQFGIRRH